MNSRFANTLAFAATAAAFACATLIAASPAYAETPTIDTTPFVSTRTRDEVRSELMQQAELARSGAREWAMQQNGPRVLASGFTSAQAKQRYIAAREEVSALTGEDSGSMYLARLNGRGGSGSVTIAGSAR